MVDSTQPFKAMGKISQNPNPAPVPAKASNGQDAIFGYMRQSSDTLRRIENALVKTPIPQTTTLMTPFSVTATTTAAPITMHIPGARGKPAYFFAVTVTSMGTATKVYLGNKDAQLLELTVPYARMEFFCTGYLVDVSDVYVKTDVGTATVIVTGYIPTSAADNSSSTAVQQ
jgi:hypothetical protein